MQRHQQWCPDQGEPRAPCRPADSTRPASRVGRSAWLLEPHPAGGAAAAEAVAQQPPPVRQPLHQQSDMCTTRATAAPLRADRRVEEGERRLQMG